MPTSLLSVPCRIWGWQLAEARLLSLSAHSQALRLRLGVRLAYGDVATLESASHRASSGATITDDSDGKRSASRPVDDLADAGLVAVHGIKGPSGLSDRRKLLLHRGQAGEAFLDFAKALIDEIKCVCAGGVSAVAHLEDPAKLAKRQPNPLAGEDEPDAAQRGGRVVPVPGLGALGHDQTQSFVVAQGLGGDSGARRQLPNSHRSTIALDLAPRGKVYPRPERATRGGSMQVTLRYFTECPNWKVAEERLREALRRSGRSVAIVHEVIETHDQAEQIGFRGSPSVVIDGRDAFPDQAEPIGLSCRIYRTADGPQGAPSVDQLTELLAR